MDDEAIQRQIEAALGVYRTPGRRRDLSGENALIARISTQEERHSANTEQTSMPLIENDRARDIVLFYGRQDAAHALLNTISLLGEIVGLRRQTRVLIGLVVLLLLGLVALCGLLVTVFAHGLVR